MKQPPVKRKLRNLILDPRLQMRLAIHCGITSVAFAAAIYFILLMSYRTIQGVIVELVGHAPQVYEVVARVWAGTEVLIYGAAAAYILVIVGLTILYTHKMVGPVVAFQRHLSRLAEGDFNAQTKLRRGDAFKGLADALNRLSVILAEEQVEKDSHEQRRAHR